MLRGFSWRTTLVWNNFFGIVNGTAWYNALQFFFGPFHCGPKEFLIKTHLKMCLLEVCLNNGNNVSVLDTRYQMKVQDIECFWLSIFLIWVPYLQRLGAIPCRRKWQPTPVLLPGKSHGQRSLVGYSPWGCTESDTTERLRFHFHFSPSKKKYKYTQ